MREPSQQKVLDSIDSGIRKAERDYRKGTTWPIHLGPEYFMTVNIYQAILRLTQVSSLTLEDKPSRLARICGNRRLPGPKPMDARLNGRCDLVLFYLNANDDEARALIEVKRDAQKLTIDLGRLERLLKEGLEFCVLASCLFEKVENNKAKEAQDELCKTLGKLHRKINSRLAKGNINVTLSRSAIKKVSFDIADENVEEYFWRPVCFVMSRQD